MRDELPRVVDSIRHHREIGVDRFVIIDNASSDGTIDFLCEQPDVDVFLTLNKYSEARGATFWRTKMLERYGYGRWYLTIDADELLVYSDMDRHDLHDLGALLRSWGSKLFFAPMIDMYSDIPFQDIVFRPGDKQIDACRFFDGEGYFLQRRGYWITSIESGGPRSRIFSARSCLDKRPFFYWDKTGRCVSAHRQLAHGAKPGPSGALLHFKFMSDFSDKISFAIESEEYWNESSEYKTYKVGIENDATRALFYHGSRRYNGPHSLIAAKLMHRIHWGCKRPTRRALLSVLWNRPLLDAMKLADW